MRILLFSFLFLLAGLFYLLEHSLYGVRAQVIVSDSMRPTFRAGTLVFTLPEPKQWYKKDDIITFRPPRREIGLVTHRVMRAYISDQGLRELETKGDANTNGDPWTLTPGEVVGKVRFWIPFIGFIILILQTRLTFVILSSLFFIAAVGPELLNI